MNGHLKTIAMSSRREFLKKGTLASTALMSIDPMRQLIDKLIMQSDQTDWSARAIAIINKSSTIDLHSHLGLWESKGIEGAGIFSYMGDDKLAQNLEDMMEGGCKAAFICITSDMPIIELGNPGNKKRDFKGQEGWLEYKRQMSILNDLCSRLPMKIVTDSAQLKGVSKDKKVGIFLSTEGGHIIEGNPGRLSEMYQDGIRKFQPIHYAKTKLGDNQSDPAYFGGLTPEGKTSIKEAVRHGMLIDMAHASYQATKQAADISERPLVLSHTMMKYDSKKYGSYHYDFPRWISEDHAKLIADTGGIIGTWPLPKPLGAASQDAFIEAVFKMVDTVGIDHVGWATDYIDSIMPTNPIFSSYKNWPALCGRFLEKGFSEEDLSKFIGGNLIRIFNNHS